MSKVMGLRAFCIVFIIFIYASNASGSWETEIVANNSGIVDGDSSDSSIAVDSSGEIHISYYDCYEKGLKYASKSSEATDWKIETVDSVIEGEGHYTSLAVDSSRKVHISYYDSENGNLRYATKKLGEWVPATVDSSGDVGRFTSIAVDSSGKVHISYSYSYYASFSNLKYATTESGVWVTKSVDSSGSEVGWFNAIAVDSSRKVHISYSDNKNGNLKYATNKSGSWVTATVDSTENAGWFTSIAVDSSDKVHISYSYSDYGLFGNLRYATNKSGEWVTETVDSTGAVGYLSSSFIDSSDNLHISYYDYTNGSLKYAINKSGKWVTETVDSSGDAGWFSSLTVDSSGVVHISYYDKTNGNLKYAKKTSITSKATVTTGSATDVTSGSATLNGMVNSNGLDTLAFFEYGTMTGSYTKSSVPQTVTGSGDTTINIKIDVLSPETTYYFRLAAENKQGVEKGGESSFETNKQDLPPTALTGSATNVTSDSATLNGTVSAHGSITTFTWFEYDTISGSYNNTSTVQTIRDSNDTLVSVNVSGLSPETIYYYRFVAQNIMGTTKGDESSFNTTLPDPPQATTESAKNVTLSLATLTGTVDANGSLATVLFEYGTITGSYTNLSGTQPVNRSNNALVSIAVNGLLSDTTYYYRIKAESLGGTVEGTEMSFTTTKPVSQTLSPSQAKLELNKEDSEGKEVTITLTGSDESSVSGHSMNQSGAGKSEDTIPIVGKKVKAQIIKGTKFTSLSPKRSIRTDANGEAKFTIIPTGKTGKGKVIFKSGKKKTTVSLIVR